MALDPQSGTLLASEYRLTRQIGGRGLWAATSEAAPGEISIQLLLPFDDDTMRQCLDREMQTVGELSSPNVARVLGTGVERGTPFVVMEPLEGEDLETRLERVERLPLHEVLPLATGIARGLDAAHTAGVVHRDLKPSSVFLAKTGNETTVKLLDFGRVLASPMAPDLTAQGGAHGSPHYISPEQTACRAVDLRSDLWSFAVVLYRAITGKRPFDGDELTSILFAIARETPKPPSRVVPDLPPALDAFFVKALKKDAVDRFQTADELLSALREALSEARVEAEAPQAGAVRQAPVTTPTEPQAPERAAPQDRTTLHVFLIGGAIALFASTFLVTQWRNVARELGSWWDPSSQPNEPAAPEPDKPTEPLPQTVYKVPPLRLSGPRATITLPRPETTIVNVWLEACSDCMPSFNAWKSLREHGKLPNAPIVNVAFGRSDPAWAESFGVGDNVVIDPGDRLIRPLGIHQFTTLVVEPSGDVVFQGRPSDRGFAEALSAAVTKATDR